jgi:hypothetical protein
MTHIGTLHHIERHQQLVSHVHLELVAAHFQDHPLHNVITTS